MPALQGISTKVYEIETDKLISRHWAESIATLGPLAARVNIRVAPGETQISHHQRERYRDGLLRLRDGGIQRCFVLLGWEFMPGLPGFLPSDPLDELDWSNNYIREFASRAAEFAGFLADSDASHDFIVWNEPNQAEPILPTANFASLLKHCWEDLRSIGRLYMGGIYLNQENVGAGLAYLDSVYRALNRSGRGESETWPWHGTNVHIHGDWRDRSVDDIWSGHRNSITRLKTKWSDPSDVLIGEWGLSEQMQAEAPSGVAHMSRALGTRAGFTFFFTLDAFQEGEHTWGLYDWSNAGPELTLIGERPTIAPLRRAMSQPDS